MGWVKSAVGWGAFGCLLGVVLVNLEETSEPVPFVVLLTVMTGLLGLVFHHRDRVDAREDEALADALHDPASTELAMAWLERLRRGEHIDVGTFVSLTPDGVRWKVLRKRFVRWTDIEMVKPWTMSMRGMRMGRGVRLRANRKEYVISTSKRRATSVLATCATMADHGQNVLT